MKVHKIDNLVDDSKGMEQGCYFSKWRLEMKYQIETRTFENLKNGISNEHFMWLLNELYLIGKGKNKKKEILRSLFAPRLYMHDLENMYRSVSAGLSEYYSIMTQKTGLEEFVEFQLKQSKYKFHSSHWIGNVNVDFYIPAYRMVIEVNGGVHHREFKMKKDNYRDRKLMNSMGLWVFEIENDDVCRVHHDLRHFLNSGKTCNYNTVFNDRKRICIDTVASHLSFQDFSNLLKYDFSDVLDELKKFDIIA